MPAAPRGAALCSAVVLALALGGCAEMRQPPPGPPPPDLVAAAPDAVRQAIGAAAASFADAGAGMAGRPAAVAQAAAQLEFATDRLWRDPRWGAMPEGIRREMLLARTELRDAIGVQDDAAPDAAVAGLLRAARALRAGDRRAAGRALAVPLFRPGGENSVARLGDTGPLPQVANATALAQAAVTRLEAEGRLGSTQMQERSAGIGGVGVARDPAGY